MAYIRKKQVKGHTYYQVVRGYRDANGNPRQSNIVSLGRHPTIEEAMADNARQLQLAKRYHKRLLGLWPNIPDGPLWWQRNVAKAWLRVGALMDRELGLKEAAATMNGSPGRMELDEGAG